MSAVGVVESTVCNRQIGAGSNPSAALHAIRVIPVAIRIAKQIIVRHHYLHTLPGGTCLAFGILIQRSLAGALTLGVGSTNAHRLVEGASPENCLSLTRLWMSDDLPPNSESRVLGIVIRGLRRHTNIKFLVTYADPSQGHVGTIYQATNWVYTGVSSAMSRYDVGDGKPRHSRSLGHSFGTHSVRYFAAHGVKIKMVPQTAKHRYLFFLDSSWRGRLAVPHLPYPKQEGTDENH